MRNRFQDKHMHFYAVRRFIPISLFSIPVVAFVWLVLAQWLGLITCLFGSCLWTGMALYISLMLITVESASGKTSRVWLIVPAVAVVCSIWVYYTEQVSFTRHRHEAMAMNLGQTLDAAGKIVSVDYAAELVAGYNVAAKVIRPLRPSQQWPPGVSSLLVVEGLPKQCERDDNDPNVSRSYINVVPFDLDGKGGGSIHVAGPQVCIVMRPFDQPSDPISFSLMKREFWDGLAHGYIYSASTIAPDGSTIRRVTMVEDPLQFPIFPKIGFVVRPTVDGTDSVSGLARRDPLVEYAEKTVSDQAVFASLIANVLGARRR